MKKKMKISEILKGKAEGMRLWSPLIGDCFLTEVNEKGIEVEKDGWHFDFFDDGRCSVDGLYAEAEAEDEDCAIFPSRGMRDWEKMGWKRGDVLERCVDPDCVTYVIFDRFVDADCMEFRAEYAVNVVRDGRVGILDYTLFDTSEFASAWWCVVPSVYKLVGDAYGGRFNRGIYKMEVDEKNGFMDFENWMKRVIVYRGRPEFKVGEIVVVEGRKGKRVRLKVEEETKMGCLDCCWGKKYRCMEVTCRDFKCRRHERKDGKAVRFVEVLGNEGVVTQEEGAVAQEEGAVAQGEGAVAQGEDGATAQSSGEEKGGAV